MDIIKYALWILSAGLAFAGSWFLKYTDDDPRRKHLHRLTKAGRIALPLAAISFLAAIGLEILDDLQSRESALDDARWRTEAITILRGVAAREESKAIEDPGLPEDTGMELNNVSHRSTWSALITLGEIKATFAQSGGILMKDFASWPTAGSDSTREMAAKTLATRIDRMLTTVNQARYEDHLSKSAAIVALAKVLADPTRSLKELADEVDTNYLF